VEFFHLPEGQRIPGPAQIDSIINQDIPVSQSISLLNTNGSEVLVGSVLTIPVDQSLLYIRPLYVSSKGQGASIPELKKVIVVYNGQVYYENTLQEALQDAFPGLAQITQEQGVGQPNSAPAPGSSTTTTTPANPSGPTTSVPGGQTIGQLLTQAEADFTAANAALAKNPPDFATYEAKIQAGVALVAQAAQEAGSPAGGSPAPPTTRAPSASSTVPPASPSTSPTTSAPAASTASAGSARFGPG
jgi:uncharacterized protein